MRDSELRLYAQSFTIMRNRFFGFALPLQIRTDIHMGGGIIDRICKRVSPQGLAALPIFELLTRQTDASQYSKAGEEDGSCSQSCRPSNEIVSSEDQNYKQPN